MSQVKLHGELSATTGRIHTRIKTLAEDRVELTLKWPPDELDPGGEESRVITLGTAHAWRELYDDLWAATGGRGDIERALAALRRRIDP